eukprot:scaffold1831_cov198-Alexandrium_tamarense.AAC.9
MDNGHVPSLVQLPPIPPSSTTISSYPTTIRGLHPRLIQFISTQTVAVAMSFLNKIGKLITGSPATSQATASRSVARERLSVILAAQRGSDLLDGVDVEALQRELMEVVQRHITAAKARSASFNVKSEGDVSLFEMSVELNGGRNDTDNNTARQQ